MRGSSQAPQLCPPHLPLYSPQGLPRARIGDNGEELRTPQPGRQD